MIWSSLMQAIWRGDKVKSMNRGTRASGAASVKIYEAVPVSDYPGQRDGLNVKENQVVPLVDKQEAHVSVQYRPLVEKEHHSGYVSEYQPLSVDECECSAVVEYQRQQENEHHLLAENGKPQAENESQPSLANDYVTVQARPGSLPVREYRSISLVPSLSWSSDDEDSDDDIVLRDFTKSESECPLLYRESGKRKSISYGMEINQENSDNSVKDIPCISVHAPEFHGSDDSSESGNELKPGGLDSVSRNFIPPPSPGMLSTNSQWSDLIRLGQSGSSRHSSFSGLSDRRVSNVSSSLSEHLRYLVRAFSSRTEKVKESTVQPPSPSSLSDYDFENSDNISGTSGEPTQFRHRLDSFFPPEIPEDSISAIEQLREEHAATGSQSEKKRKLPSWIKKIRIPHVLDPHSKLYLFWLFIVTLAFMYNAYSIPLRAVFPYQTDENLKYWLLSDYLCDFIYIIDILIFKVRISFLNSGLKESENRFEKYPPSLSEHLRVLICEYPSASTKGKRKMSRRTTRRNYMQKTMFKFDCISLLPLDLFYLVNMTVNPWLRLPRILKIQTFWEFYSRCDHLVRSAHTLRIVKTMTYMLFLIHIETCGYYAMSLYEGIGTNPWVYNGLGNAYIRCFYLATKTATSIGNNPKPTNELEWIFMTVYWVSGVFVFALLIGQIRDIVDAANLVKTVYNKRMDAALTYVKSMNLPKETQDRVRTWFIYNWQQQKVIDERRLMDALPKKLRTDLAIHVHFNTLSKVKLFQDCDKNLLYDLVLKLKPILYLPGDYVCKKGEIGKEMYIVSQGIVEVVGGPDNALVLATLREGSVFGEISLLAMAAEGNRRTADVRCSGFTNLFILSKNEFEAAMKDYPAAHKLLKKRANKLLRINAKLQKKSTSSTDNSKINAEEIIKVPHETPKMVKTVIQVMNPKSSVVRHLSGRSDKFGSSEISIPVPDIGKENKGYDDTSSDKQTQNQEKSMPHTPTMQEIEDFFDEILERTYEQEQKKKALEQRNIDANVDENVPEKKTSNSSESSNDSGVQDTKTTSSPAPSTSRTISNKDSKESFISNELRGILEDDDEECDDVKPTLTEDMFESPEEYKRALVELHEDILREMRQELYFDSMEEVDVSENDVHENFEQEKIENQYEESFVNGFPVTVESLDETNRKMSRSLSSKRFNFAFPGHVCADANTTKQNDAPKESTPIADKSTERSKECKARSSIECDPDNEAVASTSKQRNVQIKVKPAIPPKPIHLLHNLNNKNKFGLRINTETKTVPSMPHVNETERSFDSGFRSFDSGCFDTNRKNNKGNKVNVKKPKSVLQYNDDSIIVEEEPSIIVEEDTSSSKSDVTLNEDNLNPHESYPPLIAIHAPSTETMSTDGSSLWFNKADLAKEGGGDASDNGSKNQVTCTVEVHREKTLSPTGSVPEVQSPRRRKISVVSKDEIETFV